MFIPAVYTIFYEPSKGVLKGLNVSSMKTGTMSSEKQAHLYSTLIYKAGLE